MKVVITTQEYPTYEEIRVSFLGPVYISPRGECRLRSRKIGRILTHTAHSGYYEFFSPVKGFDHTKVYR